MFNLPVAMQVLDLKTTPVIYLHYLFIAIAIVADFSFFISSAVQKCIDHDVVMTKGISFMYMMSASSGMVLCCCIISVGSSCIVVTTRDDFFEMFCIVVILY